MSTFIKLVLARTHTHTHTHTHTRTWAHYMLSKEVGSFGCFQVILEGELTWFLKWTQQEIFPSPFATDRSFLVAKSIPLPDWDQWPVTKIKRRLQLPDWVISVFSSGESLQDCSLTLNFSLPGCHRYSQGENTSPISSPWIFLAVLSLATGIPWEK